MAVAAAGGLVALSAGAAELVVAERGKVPEYSIVVPANASPSQEYAAEELRDFVEKSTGVLLPVVTDADPMPPKAIVLGTTKWTCRSGPAHEDGFRIVAKPPHVFVVGSAARGTLYGVYEFLERFAGVRWYASWRTVVPKKQRITVPAALDDVQTPAFDMREPYWYDVIRHPEFAARLRVNSNSRSCRRLDEKLGGTPYRFGGGLSNCHTFEILLPPEKHFADHPEYFSMVGGRRIKARTQLCLTNPDVLRIVTSNVLERIRKDPGAKFYGVSQNDWYNYCECPKCKAVDDEEGSHAGTMVRFVNAIAEKVEKEFPDAIIETLAYQYTRKAPKKTKLRRNVVPCLCSMECDFALPIDRSPYKENISFRKDIEDWGRMTDFLYIWDYTTDFSHYTMPWANCYALQGNVQFFRKNKVRALFELGAYQGRHADFAELKAWLLAKWMWNPDLPMKPLLDDFFAGYYGKGAPFVREYFEKLHKLQTKYSSQANHPLLCFDGPSNSAIPDAFLDEAAGLWRRAIVAVKDDPATSYNVRMGAFSVDYMRMERSRKQVYLLGAAPIVSGEKAKNLAKSLLDKMDEAKDIRLAEGDRAELIREWREIIDGGLVPFLSANGELEDKFIPILHRGTWGDYVDDPKAEDGKALKLFNTHFTWCVQMPLSRIGFAPGKKYRLSVRVRVEKERDGEAFWAGIHGIGTEIVVAPRIASVPNGGYHWYVVANWTPAPDEYFWIGPPHFTADGKSPVKGVYLDKIKFEEISATKSGRRKSR